MTESAAHSGMSRAAASAAVPPQAMADQHILQGRLALDELVLLKNDSGSATVFQQSGF